MILTAKEGEEFLIRLKEGDEAAFKFVFERYKDKLYNFSLKITKSEELAEEIVHDVFLKVWINREQINSNLSFNAFLFKITKNASLNFLKKCAVDKKLIKHLRLWAEEGHNETENFIFESDYNLKLQNAINQLPPQQQLVFKLSRIDGLTHEEIAKSLRLSKGTVKNYIMIAVASVRKYLNIWGDKIVILFSLLWHF